MAEIESKTTNNLDFANLIKNVTVPQMTSLQDTGTYFFRARPAESLLSLENWNARSFTNLPSYKIKYYGRLNKPHEEMMYFTSDKDQVLTEIGYSYQKPVVVAAYQVINPFSTLDIGRDFEKNQITGLKVDELSQIDTLLRYFRSAFSQKPSNKLNEFTTKIREHYYPLKINKDQAWTYPVMGPAKPACFNLAMYPDLARQYLEFKGAVVISKANKSGMKQIDFCFDEQYRLDYVKAYPKLKKIFGLE